MAITAFSHCNVGVSTPKERITHISDAINQMSVRYRKRLINIDHMIDSEKALFIYRLFIKTFDKNASPFHRNERSYQRWQEDFVEEILNHLFYKHDLSNQSVCESPVLGKQNALLRFQHLKDVNVYLSEKL